jgi:hypothetical protein
VEDRSWSLRYGTASIRRHLSVRSAKPFPKILMGLASRCSLDHKMSPRTPSDSDYWLRQYQVEANENERIRELIKVKLDAADDTVTVEHVRDALRREYARGYEASKRKSEDDCKKQQRLQYRKGCEEGTKKVVHLLQDRVDELRRKVVASGDEMVIYIKVTEILDDLVTIAQETAQDLVVVAEQDSVIS